MEFSSLQKRTKNNNYGGKDGEHTTEDEEEGEGRGRGGGMRGQHGEKEDNNHSERRCLSLLDLSRLLTRKLGLARVSEGDLQWLWQRMDVDSDGCLSYRDMERFVAGEEGLASSSRSRLTTSSSEKGRRGDGTDRVVTSPKGGSKALIGALEKVRRVALSKWARQKGDFDRVFSSLSGPTAHDHEGERRGRRGAMGQKHISFPHELGGNPYLSPMKFARALRQLHLRLRPSEVTALSYYFSIADPSSTDRIGNLREKKVDDDDDDDDGDDGDDDDDDDDAHDHPSHNDRAMLKGRKVMWREFLWYFFDRRKLLFVKERRKRGGNGKGKFDRGLSERTIKVALERWDSGGRGSLSARDFAGALSDPLLDVERSRRLRECNYNCLFSFFSPVLTLYPLILSLSFFCIFSLFSFSSLSRHFLPISSSPVRSIISISHDT